MSAVDEAAVARLHALRIGVAAPFEPMCKRMRLLFLLVPFVGVGAGLVARQPLVALGVALAFGGLAALATWWPLLDRTYRAAFDLYLEHDRIDQAEWEVETGTKRPRSLAEVENWLSANPDSPNRQGLLLGVGRLAEFDSLVDGTPRETPRERFTFALRNQTRRLIGAEPTDLGEVRTLWHALIDPRVRRMKGECLAVLEAEIAVAEGREVVPVLASGYAALGNEGRTAGLWSVLLRWFVTGAVVPAVIAAAMTPFLLAAL
jgi:hypothetical protein